MSADKIERALIRMLWRSIADNAECTCGQIDICPECLAMQALGLDEWVSAEHAAQCLPVLGRPCDSHVAPTDERHDLSPQCWCRPHVDDGQPTSKGRAWIHQAENPQDQPGRRWVVWLVQRSDK